MPVRTLLIRWASALQSVQRIERLAKVTSGSVRLHLQHGVCFTICACALRRSVSSCDVIHFCIVVIRCNSEGIPAACLSCQATGIMKRAVIRSSRNHLVKCFLLACRRAAITRYYFNRRCLRLPLDERDFRQYPRREKLVTSFQLPILLCPKLSCTASVGLSAEKLVTLPMIA